MAKKEVVDNVESEKIDLDLVDVKEELPLKKVPIKQVVRAATPAMSKNDMAGSGNIVNCLRNERVIVRFIPRLTGIWGNNPKHILAGGMSEGSVRTFTIPKLASGMYYDILSNSEKACLEEAMGLEYNALSIYKKVDNFWDDSNDVGINQVRLTKQDNFLDLSIPEDYIKYKILLANKDFIAPSLQVLEDLPKITYQFVIIAENEESKMAKSNMSCTMMCYKEFGKIESDFDVLRTVIETVSGKPTSKNVKLEFLQTQANDYIQSDGKFFLKVVTDPMLQTKVLIKKATEAGIISNRGNYLYLKDGNTPLCGEGEEPTLNVAAKFINLPKNQEMKFTIQAKLKQ